jgi:hypothetical protein
MASGRAMQVPHNDFGSFSEGSMAQVPCGGVH